MNIPGFRRGKAPRALVERYAGPAAINEERSGVCCPSATTRPSKRQGLRPSSARSSTSCRSKREPLIFKATVALQPTIDLDGYQHLEIKPDTVEVREDEVQNVLERWRETQAQWVPVEDRGVEMGDQVIADVKTAFADEGEGKPAPDDQSRRRGVVLGENNYPEGFDQAVLGARAGDTRTFTLRWPFGRRRRARSRTRVRPNSPSPSRTSSARNFPSGRRVRQVAGRARDARHLRQDVRRRLRDDALRAERAGDRK